MLSGIGPAAHLSKLGISIVLDLPGVGENLQDHLDVCTLYKSTRGRNLRFQSAPGTRRRAALLAAASRPWCLERRRGRRVRAQLASARRPAGYSAAFRAGAARRSRAPPPAGTRLHAARLLSPAAEPRPHPPVLRRRARRPADLRQLPAAPARSRRVAGSGAAQQAHPADTRPSIPIAASRYFRDRTRRPTRH